MPPIAIRLREELRLVALGVATSRQLTHWRDGVALFEHTLAATGENPSAQANLGIALIRAGRVDEGVEALAGALQMSTQGEQARATLVQSLHRIRQHFL